MPSLQDLFDAVVELSESARTAYLDEHCAGDERLRAQVIGLLAVDRRLANTVPKSATSGIATWVQALSGTDLRPGQTVGAFRILEPIGQGGMGVVFRGERHDGTVTQQVAIKVIRREFLDAETRHRFARERQALATLDHPCIARLIDAAELPDGTPYFVMEYVDGQPITEYCARQNLDLRARVRLMRQVCQAVAHAHRHLIVHRDLKPGNILVDADGRPKLLDFGIAKDLRAVDDKELMATGTAQRFFSPRYAAPEQLRGGAVQVGCDVHALGVLLFELSCGQGPFDFEGLSFGQVEALVVDMPAPAPSMRVDPSLPGAAARRRALRGDLDGIVQRCLRKDPAERYASAMQLDEDLERWLSGMPVSARHGHRWYRFRKFIGRHRIAASITMLAMVALTVAAVALWQQNLALRDERDRSGQALAMMQDAFIAADPIRAAGADINARQILKTARRRLDPIETTQPALFATLAQTIAQVELSLGESEQAANLFARAGVAAAHAGFDAPTRMKLAVLEARALINDDRLDAAGAVLASARALEPAPGPVWQSMQGRWLSIRGDSDEGIAMLRTAVAAMSDVGPEDEYATSTRYALAEALGMGGDAQGELATLDATLAWQTTQLASDHPQVLRTRLRRLIALRVGGRAEQSVTEAKAMLGEVTRIFGAETAEAAYVHNALARSLEALGKSDDALASYREALSATIKSQGHDHANARRIMFNLAWTLQETGRHDAEADELFREALASASRRVGAQAEITVYYRLYYARFLIARNRAREALVLLATPDAETGFMRLSEPNRSELDQTLRTLNDGSACAGNAAMPECALIARWLAQTRSAPAPGP